MTDIERLRPLGHKSDAVVAGGLIWVSGQIASDCSLALAEQARNVLEKVAAILEACRSDTSRIVNATVWLADVADYEAFNAVWKEWIPSVSLPARACVGAQLAVDNAKVEVAVVAAVSNAHGGA